MNISEFNRIIWEVTRKINDNASRILNPVCESYGLTMMQIRILMELKQFDSHTVGSLAESMYVACANMSAMCKKLENMGLLRRTRDNADERVVNVTLTEKGNSIVSEIDNFLNEKVLQNIGDVGEDIFEELINGLQKFNSLLESISVAE